jgi:hypothetical protein
MSLIHKLSSECTKSELDLFDVPPTQIAYESARMVDYYPLANIGNGPIEFFVSGSSNEEYIDPSQTFLLVKCEITKADGTQLGTSEVCGPVNNIIDSMFSQIDVYLNDTLITSSVNTYAYRAYIENEVNYGEDAKTSHLTASMWYKDTAGKMDSLSENQGYTKRVALTKGKTFEVYGRPHVDFFFQDRFLINNVNMKLRLSPSKHQFCLMGTNNLQFKLKIHEAILSVRKVKVNPKIILAHAQVLEKTTLKYPIKRVETKLFTIPQGLFSKTIDNVSLGNLPKKIVFGLVLSEAYDGTFSTNCFNFQHFNLSKISVSVDGEEAPYSPIEMDFTNNQYIRAYYTLFNGLDKAGLDSGNNISRDDFANGYTIFAFDLSPDSCNGGHFNLVKSGNLRINLNFKKALEAPVNLIVYMEHENIIEINKHRNVIFDYNV